ncbi:Hypothetical predicted protein [Marmota monax]|uniref:Uncharacterized protein n=1 Tax=Marmota monax TaxID=9995 RepID=A0A5E4B4N2_MARMO|nr:hypothetical protein GHT09_009206 [Marmota monax]VTJ64305.1 Hypothetical predicted protein [Marmota monax]
MCVPLLDELRRNVALWPNAISSSHTREGKPCPHGRRFRGPCSCPLHLPPPPSVPLCPPLAISAEGGGGWRLVCTFLSFMVRFGYFAAHPKRYNLSPNPLLLLFFND